MSSSAILPHDKKAQIGSKPATVRDTADGRVTAVEFPSAPSVHNGITYVPGNAFLSCMGVEAYYKIEEGLDSYLLYQGKLIPLDAPLKR